MKGDGICPQRSTAASLSVGISTNHVAVVAVEYVKHEWLVRENLHSVTAVGTGTNRAAAAAVGISTNHAAADTVEYVKHESLVR